MELPRVDEVLGGHWPVSLVPFHSRGQLAPPRQWIDAGPRFRGEGNDMARLVVYVRQRVEDVVLDQAALDVGADQGTEIAEIPAEDPDPQIPPRLCQRGRHTAPEQKTACRGCAFDQGGPTEPVTPTSRVVDA